MTTYLGSTITSTASSYDNTTAGADITTPGGLLTPEGATWQSATEFLKHYYIWIIFAFGFPGNMFCVFVIIRMSRRHLSTTLFFVAFLAAVDTFAIFLRILRNQTYYNGVVMGQSACQFLSVFGLTIPAYANWVLLVMAAERYTAVRFPLKVGVIWSLRKAIAIVIFVFVVITLIHSHLFVTLTNRGSLLCQFKDNYDHFRPVWYYISAAVYAIVPATILIVFNILIIWMLKKSGRQRRTLLPEVDSSVVEARRQERQITVMLVTVTVVFVVLTLPTCIYILVFKHWVPHNDRDKERKAFVAQLTLCLASTNHAVNFYMYFISGKRFRTNSVSILKYRPSWYKEMSNRGSQNSKTMATDTAV